jgi:hypothetical protein
MKARLFLCLILLSSLIACKKDEEAAPDRRALLTAHGWRLNEALANGVAVTDPQLLSAIGVLSQSTVRFNADGTLTATDNTTGAVTNGTWQFGSSQDQLLVSVGSSNYTFTIKMLDAAQLVLTTPYSVSVPPVPAFTVNAELRMIPA